MKFSHFIILFTLCVLPFSVQAQKEKKINPEDRVVDMDSPTLVPMVRVSKVFEGGDSIQYVEMNNVYVYGPIDFKNERQRKSYNRLVYNVKKVLPIAKEVNRAVLETYEYLQTLPDDKARKEHMKLVEKSLMDSSSYELVQVFFGSTRASFYQAFAWVLGASLKKAYDPNGVDRLTERVVRQVESGQL